MKTKPVITIKPRKPVEPQPAPTAVPTDMPPELEAHEPDHGAAPDTGDPT